MTGIVLVGEPVTITFVPGGHDSPTFLQRRKLTIHNLVEADSLQLYKQDEGAAVHFGEMLGHMLHRQLNAEGGPKL